MFATPFGVTDDEMELSRLAMRYRHYRDPAIRDQVKKDYAVVVDRLIKSGAWNEVPSPEDQLPEEDMPKAFFDYWFSDLEKA